jgi:hypothetical protein
MGESVTFQYLPSFDITDDRNAFGTITFTRFPVGNFTLSIKTDIANSINADSETIRVLNHYPTGIASAVGEDSEANAGLSHTAATQSFGALIQQRIRSAAIAASWANGNTLTCAYNTTTMRYTFGYGGTLVSIAFSTTETRRLFGFSGDFSGSSSSVTGDITPSFAIQPTLSDVTTKDAEGVNYEPSGISTQTVSNAGSVFGLTRACVPLFRDWTQQSELKAKAIRMSASSTHPATHQALFERCRSVLPFVVVGGFGDGHDYVFKLRPDSCMWSTNVCKRASGETDDTAFDISYRTQVMGVFP